MRDPDDRMICDVLRVSNAILFQTHRVFIIEAPGVIWQAAARVLPEDTDFPRGELGRPTEQLQ